MQLFSAKIESKYELDDPRRTLEHREIILSKPFLKSLYEEWYAVLLKETASCPEGVKLEIGAGGGFLKEIEPNIITSDILDLPVVDKVFSAEEMPFSDNEVSAIMMVNVFHHIPDCRKFLREAQRVLKSGGKIVMIEPANSVWSRFIYKNFHHELFDEKRDWTFPSAGPLSGSNQALPYIVFERDRAEFDNEFPNLEVAKIELHTGLRYLFSGGVSRMQMIPSFAGGFVKFIENLFPSTTGMFQTIVVQKK